MSAWALCRRPAAGLRRVRPFAAGVAGCTILATIALAVPPEPTKYSAVLDLPGDGFLTGRLVPAPAAGGAPRGTLLWQSLLSEQPLEFALDGIEGIRFPKAQAAPVADDAWRVDLRGGDFVVGALESVDADLVVVQAVGLGDAPLRIRRPAVVRMSRAGSASRTILPGSLAGWDAAKSAWREQGGRLSCDTAGSVCSRDVAAAPRACFELLLSWDERPDLEMHFAASPEQTARLKGATGGKKAVDGEEYRIELASGDMLAIREGATAKFDFAGTVPAGPGSLHLRAFVDQERGRLVVELPAADPGARVAFDQTLAPRKATHNKAFAFKLLAGSVRIDRLRVSAWVDEEPRVSTAGSLGGAESVVEAFDAKAAAFTVRGAEGPRQVAARDVSDIEFPAPAPGPEMPAPGSVLAVLHGGTRLTGRMLEVTPAVIRLACPAAADEVACEIGQLAVLDAAGGRRPSALPGRPGMLEMLGARMIGCLVDMGDGIGWQPWGATGPRAIGAAVTTARVAYRGFDALGGVGFALTRQGDAWVVAELTAGGPAARDGRIGMGWKLDAIRLGDADVPAGPLKLDEVRGLLRGVMGSPVRLRLVDPAGAPHDIALVRDAAGRGDLAGAAAGDVLEKALAIQAARSVQPAPAAGGQSVVFLKTGDAVICSVLSADPAGVRIRMNLVPDVLVPAVAVQAVELVETTGGTIPKDKFTRLLTLPRMQAADPPTHMLRLANGDYLRGKLLSLDEETVRVDVLGKTKQFPRAKVTRLIWLASEGDSSAADALAAVAGGEGAGIPVRATMTNGRRLTMKAEHVVGDRLVGTSGVLGAVGVELARCTHLDLRPPATEPAGTERPYAKWILKPAPAPRALGKPAGKPPADDPRPDDGAQHPLVGKDAPGLVLQLPEPMPDGRTSISLVDWEGHIVVLWLFSPQDAASLAVLPRLVAAFEPLAADGVTCMAVGSGATADVVAKAVGGLPRRPAIGIDRTGNLERQLGRPALPTCLVIDREGHVAAVLPAGPTDIDAVQARVAGIVDRSRRTAPEFAALGRAREEALAKDRACLEHLGALLDAESATVRARSAALLRQLTGLVVRDMPYTPDGPPAQRTEQTRRWRQWLAAEGISAELSFPRRGAP